jgi:hypothetical protein
MVGTARRRFLTLNCHEGYVHLLGKLGVDWDVIDGLPGRHTGSWDTRMRPVPERAKLVTLAEATSHQDYEAVVLHSVQDLMDVRAIDAPKILILHVSLTARALEEPGSPPPSVMSRQLAQYLELIAAETVAVSEMKRRSWGLPATVIRPAVDPDEWDGHRGELPTLLRVGNHVNRRRTRFAWDDHESIVRGLPFRLVGHNPDMPGVRASEGWDDLRELYRSHRAYVHTAGPGLDDGYNLALIEAMGSGMPAVTTKLHASPVLDGETGFISDDLDVLHRGAARLLENPEEARKMGERARETVLEAFSLPAFVEGWHYAIDRAQKRFAARRSPTELLHA